MKGDKTQNFSNKIFFALRVSIFICKEIRLLLNTGELVSTQQQDTWHPLSSGRNMYYLASESGYRFAMKVEKGRRGSYSRKMIVGCKVFKKARSG